MINLNNESPLYKQIYEQIKKRILNGEYKSDMKLPSSRKLSKCLDISRNTVDYAYQQLVSEGLIYSKNKSGHYVEDIRALSINISNGKKYTQVKSQNKCNYTYDLRYGSLKSTTRLAHIWRKYTNKSIKDHEDKILEFIPYEGVDDLRNEIRRHINLYRGIECSIDQVVICAGMNHSIEIISKLIGSNNPSIAIESPGYSLAYQVFSNNYYTIHPLKLEYDGIDLTDIRNKRFNGIYITPSHQFPTGIVMSKEKREHLINWVEENDSFIIEDDYFYPLMKSSQKYPPIHFCCPNNVIYLSSLSRFVLPYFGMSYMVIPKRLIPRYKSLFENFPSPVPYISQKSIQLFLADGNWEKSLRKIATAFKPKYKILTECIKYEFGESITIMESYNYIYSIISVNLPLSQDQLVKRAKNFGIMISHPSKIWTDENLMFSNVLILGLGNIDNESIPNAVKLLKLAWI